MKRRVISALLAVVLVCAVSVPAFAEHLTGEDGWTVTFTTGERLESNFASSGYTDAVGTLQPGDDITLTITLKNDNKNTTDWYMANKVLSSLENSRASADGGAYSYVLTFNGPGGSRELYNSETVGGDDSQGLVDATNALQDFFFLDTLSTGQTGKVTLVITLDGETQGNGYQETLADLRMNFAVEVNAPATQTRNVQNVVKTGDEAKLLPYYIAMGVSGLLFLVLAVDSIRRRKRERRGES